MSWESQVVASLSQHLRGGYTYAQAWRLALLDHPAPSSYTGHPVACSNVECMAEQDGAAMLCGACGSPLVAEQSRAEQFRGFCEDAWAGRRPALARLSVGLLDDDGSSGAARAREYNPISVAVAA